MYSPTALHQVVDKHLMLLSVVSTALLFGLGTIDHFVPFHDSMSVWYTRLT
jgi:hypothetical protein